jgi:membrane-associated phospholipid phosphatase
LKKFIIVDVQTKNIINTKAITNYSRLKPSLFVLPLCFLILIVLYLYIQRSLSVQNYIQIQKNCFFFLNSKLSQFPNTEYNLTQFGDALIFLSLLSIFILYAPKLWEALISASLVSAIFSDLMKITFTVPRPAAVFGINSFVIVGKALSGSNSLPSGHSITVFTTLTVLLFAFMPQKLTWKILWVLFLIITGLVLAFTRVGIGAHYPLDVITGGVVGYISGLTGIFINEKYKLWSWINNKKYYPILMLLFVACFIAIINKIMDENLIIFYFALAALVASLYKMTNMYVKK